jgi:hypothetical protein
MANAHAPTGHEKIETSNFLMIVLILLSRWSAGWSRSCRCSSSAAPRSRPRASSPTPRCSWPAATSTSARAATTATRRWCGRSAPKRCATAPVHGRRVCLRPPLPVGQQAHRAGPAPRGRPLQRRMASRAPDQPARPGARVQHAGLPLAGQGHGGPGRHGAQDEGAAHGRRASTPTPKSPRRRSREGPHRMDALIAYLQVLGTAKK